MYFLPYFIIFRYFLFDQKRKRQPTSYLRSVAFIFTLILAHLVEHQISCQVLEKDFFLQRAIVRVRRRLHFTYAMYTHRHTHTHTLVLWMCRFFLSFLASPMAYGVPRSGMGIWARTVVYATDAAMPFPQPTALDLGSNLHLQRQAKTLTHCTTAGTLMGHF